MPYTVWVYGQKYRHRTLKAARRRVARMSWAEWQVAEIYDGDGNREYAIEFPD